MPEMAVRGSFDELDLRHDLDTEACSSKVNLSGDNGNVIMSGWVDDNPDDEGREAAEGKAKA